MAKAPDKVVAECPNPKCGKPIYADHINGWCIECGEPLPYSIQEKIPYLRTLREKNSAASSGPGEPETVERLSTRALLERIVKLQEQQNETLLEIRKHTGCVYAWLIISIILGVLMVLLSDRF